MSDLSAEDIKELLSIMEGIEINLDNWRYVQVNADFLPPSRVAHALEQVLDLTIPMMSTMRSVVEIEALTKFDSSDLS